VTWLAGEVRPEDSIVVSAETAWIYTYYAELQGFAAPRVAHLPRVPDGRLAWRESLAGEGRIWLLASTFRADRPDAELPTLLGELGAAAVPIRRDFPDSGVVVLRIERPQGDSPGRRLDR
jgi:hypothetical protein